MDRKPLSGGGRLRAAGYDERSRVLEIEFATGDVIQYAGVSPELYRQLLAAPSPSSFFADKIDEQFTARRQPKASKTDAAQAFDRLFSQD
jgi:hypothetical protein